MIFVIISYLVTLFIDFLNLGQKIFFIYLGFSVMHTHTPTDPRLNSLLECCNDRHLQLKMLIQMFACEGLRVEMFTYFIYAVSSFRFHY